ncbi:hypothetical protein EDC18_11143 [Natranaerovirga pectinivora]|uniref:Nitrogen regulatory protein P-II family n=1 Tax=Natranaerovirga pectinivora TaxID=682400 RepID=A0A4V2UZW2_9FIRM|nr:hypothetical protein [Natranaerovirga pectinivora]TCT12872.1 hypothetical protein EDC18_11143 [Natranaerovirga pectinivora]
MELLVLVLNKPDELEILMKEFVNIGLKGATVIDSYGMASFLHNMDDIPMFGSLKMLINNNQTSNKTVFVVLKKEQVKRAMATIKAVIGDLSQTNVGIAFTIPISQVEGGTFDN